MSQSLLTPEYLWPRLVERSRHALAVGALQPITTETRLLEAEGVRFVVRILAQIHLKKQATQQQQREKRNPFLPYETDLWVGDFSKTHVALLNKFNAVDHHLLIVTREFEDQQDPLTPGDFSAALRVLQSKPGLIFYNSGPTAGASQPHRHLQWIPFPLGFHGEAFPLADYLWRSRENPRLLPFQVALAPLPPNALETDGEGMACHACYQTLLQQLHLHPDRHSVPRPYNLLMTRDWMALIPRSQEIYQGIEVNALGFAGGLLVRDGLHLDRLITLGPFNLLRQVGVPWDY